jgi:hypothetical protein
MPYVAGDDMGNQPNQTEKTNININPSQKSGIEYPANAATEHDASMTEWCFTAAMTPRTTASTIEILNDFCVFLKHLFNVNLHLLMPS